MDRRERAEKRVFRLLSFIALFALTACQVQQHLELSNLQQFARFGRSIDQTNTVTVIGAYQENGGEGAAYVFNRRGNLWSIQTRLVSPTPGQEQFGDAVSLSGNVIAIGAPLDNQPGAVRSGSVYLFEYDGSQWNHLDTLTSPLPHQPWEAFGVAVAVADGGDLVVVGAVDRDQGPAMDAGAAFVYERAGNSYNLLDSLAVPSPAASDKFGAQVDATDTSVVVSAPRRDSGATTDAGAVYVYERAGGSFNLIQALTASDAAAEDIFGTGLGLYPVNGGWLRLIVGAEGADVGGNSSAGAAYIFEGPPSGPFNETAKLTASDGAAADIFGTEVAAWGDRVLVGASGADNTTPDSGAAYVFRLQGGVWVENEKLFLANGVEDAFLGTEVSLWNNHALLGSSGAETGVGVTDSGTVGAFRVDNANIWHDSHTLHAATDIPGSSYGRSLDLDNNRLLVSGVPHADLLVHGGDGFSLVQRFPALGTGTAILSVTLDGTTLALYGRRDPLITMPPLGYVQIFTEQGGQWLQQQLLEPDLVSPALPAESADSGVLDLEGDTLVIGARRWNGGDGRVFIYQRSGGVWSEQQVLTSPEAATNFDRNFGNHVALSGDWLAIAEVPSSGLPGTDTHGNVYIYQRVGGVFIQQQVISEPVPANLDAFGRGLAMHGDLLAIYGSGTSTLRVYRRTAGVYNEVWSQPVPDTPSGDVGLALTADQVAIGKSRADYGSLTDAGEVRVFDRQPGDTYLSGGRYRTSGAVTNQRFGRSIAMDDQRVIGSTENFSAVGGRVYSINK